MRTHWIVAFIMMAVVASGAATAAVESVDDSGRTLRLEQPARRIVTLAPHLTELLFAAGAGNALVGVAAYSDYPPQAQAIPRIGDAHALDLERIVALKPDLVVAWSSGSPKRQLGRLRALGVVVFENEPTDLEAIASAIERLGVLTGTEDRARARALRFRAELTRLRKQYARGSPVRVFYQVAERPLVSVSRGHVIADALRVCGAVSVFADQTDRLPRPSREAVLLADPEAIIVAAGADERDPFAPWRRWGTLQAVELQRLHRVDPSLLHRATPRILQGIEALCEEVAAAAQRALRVAGNGRSDARLAIGRAGPKRAQSELPLFPTGGQGAANAAQDQNADGHQSWRLSAGGRSLRANDTIRA